VVDIFAELARALMKKDSNKNGGGQAKKGKGLAEGSQTKDKKGCC